MASSVQYRKLIESYLMAEIDALMLAKGWNAVQLADAISKHVNTVRAWLNRKRLPDKANIALICAKLGADAERAAFMEHVCEQLNRGPEMVSTLEERNIFIVASAERTYGEVTKWEPIWITGLLQTEATHMKLFPGKGARVVESWLRKSARQEAFFGRADSPVGKFFVPECAIADLRRLSAKDRDAQMQRLAEVDAHPNCAVYIVDMPHHAPANPINFFRGKGMSGAGPDFVYIETLDQSRHIIDPRRVAIYHQALSALEDGARRLGGLLDDRVHRLAEECSKR